MTTTPPRRSKGRIALRWFVALTATGVVALVVWGVVWYRRAHAPALLVLSKETTFITGPVRPDGSINYVAALNKRYGQGVTRDNNGAVLFWRAMGPKDIESEYREQFFKQLGMLPLAEKGDYFVSLTKFVEQHGEPPKVAEQIVLSPTPPQDLWTERLTVALKRPWSREEFPILAQWLEANEEPLTLLTEASQRPRWFNPLIPEDGTVLSALLPAGQQWKQASQMLVARAMLRTAAGQFDAAWQDLLACHRLARLFGQGATVVDGLIAFVFEQVTCDGDEALLQQASLSKGQIDRIRRDLDQLHPLPALVEKIDVAERMMILDAALRIPRSGTETLQGLGVDVGSDWQSVNLPALVTIDWNVVLRLCNAWFDRVVAARGLPTRLQQHAELQAISDDLHGLGKDADDVSRFLRRMLSDPQAAASEQVGQILVALFMPALSTVLAAEEKCAMQFELIKIGFALAANRAEHDSYPETLAELKPVYLAEISIDLFSGAALHYERTEEGYLLYSVGINGVDDGGSEDYSQNHDDLAIRVPAEKKP